MNGRAAVQIAGVAWAALSLLDPHPGAGRWLGPLLALGGAALAPAATRWRGPALAVALAFGFSLAGLAEPEFRGDAPGYYAYLRSVFFDEDLDFGNEMSAWGLSDSSTIAPGLRHDRNPYSVGPALVWLPFFLLGHGFALLAGYAPTGFTDPYYRSLALGTVTVGITGAWLLVDTLQARFGRTAAVLAVAAVLATSSSAYYLFVVPGVSHGLAFGLACASVWALDRALREGADWPWLRLGMLLGLLVLVRWQAAVYGLPVLLGASVAIRRGRVRSRTLALAAALAAFIFLPQLAAWKRLYGEVVTVPQGAAFFLQGPQRWLDVLLHADHGLFVWTPALAFALLGLALALKDHPALATSGWLVFGMTVVLNGSLHDWAGSDAFGSRRFDVVLPFFALGFAALFVRMARLRWLSPVLLIGLFAAWNLGMMASFRRGSFATNASLEEMAFAQSRLVYAMVDRALAAVAGRRGHALAYKALVGEYLYYNVFLDGRLDLASLPERFLAGGWSVARRGPTPFRWASYPAACLRLPLEAPLELHARLTARAPDSLPQQTVSIVVNDRLVATARLTPSWSDAEFVVPEDALAPGDNRLCLRFERPAPGDDSPPLAAAVARIQLP